ncbi:G-protein coupled receptor Mth-like [Colias croceus]|uniref:G-protein coupled receptor Mth-like n=1 Tax=Colias crocea TaxID=72248 RepID=UPI001E27B677|nr:G-protein coupled receptor Mth-like [Colias croceus]
MYRVVIFVCALALVQSAVDPSSRYKYDCLEKGGECDKNKLDLDIELCGVKKCIYKCCPKGQIISNPPECKPVANDDFSNITVYDSYLNPKNKKFNDVFHVIPNKFKDINFVNKDIYSAKDFEEDLYLEESGVLYVDMANQYDRWVSITDFCIDYIASENGDTPSEPQFWVTYTSHKERQRPTTILIVALLVSSFFLLLTLGVYHWIFFNKMTLVIKIRVCLVYSYISHFISVVTIINVSVPEKTCIVISSIAYFSIMATCCWLNVMSYDTWLTFRDLLSRNLTPSEKRRRDAHKYKRYVCYGWGLPLCMASGLIIINSLDLSSLPWFITPQIPLWGCFLVGGQQFVYQYIPMIVFIFVNCLLFILTALNISCMVMDTKPLRANSGQRQKARLYICLRLSVTMGVSWIWEIISFLVPAADVVAIYLDLYNGFIGLLIFIIFVCNKHTWSLVKHRVDVLRGRVTENPNSQSDPRVVPMKRLDNNSSTSGF